MATTMPDSPAQRRETFGDDLAGMGSFYIDPQSAARRVFHKWFWIGPLVGPQLRWLRMLPPAVVAARRKSQQVLLAAFVAPAELQA